MGQRGAFLHGVVEEELQRGHWNRVSRHAESKPYAYQDEVHPREETTCAKVLRSECAWQG